MPKRILLADDSITIQKVVELTFSDGDYEVCEYVKSHPELRNIPVILLTGTFEPFDPDRADKAGCDAVVTKPFESQSLIHKVEELIDQARSTAPTAATPAMSEAAKPSAPSPAPSTTPASSPWM